MFTRVAKSTERWEATSFYPTFAEDELGYLAMMGIGDETDNIRIQEKNKFGIRGPFTFCQLAKNAWRICLDIFSFRLRDKTFLRKMSCGAMIAASRKEGFSGLCLIAYLGYLVGQVCSLL